MDWRWSALWTIIYNFAVHAITLNWNAVAQDAENFKSWWRSFWDAVQTLDDWVRDWVEGRISWLKGYAFGVIYQVSMDAARWVANLRQELTPIIWGVRDWAIGQINWLRSHLEGLVNQARDLAYRLVNEAKSWLSYVISSAISGVYNAFNWIQGYRGWITDWLMQSRGVIDWLRHQAIGQLQSFLSNPVGFVLGWLYGPIVSIINWWQRWGSPLTDFVTRDLPGLRNLLARGLSFLLTFVDRPGEVILNAISSAFLDWLENLIADNW